MAETAKNSSLAAVVPSVYQSPMANLSQRDVRLTSMEMLDAMDHSCHLRHFLSNSLADWNLVGTLDQTIPLMKALLKRTIPRPVLSRLVKWSQTKRLKQMPRRPLNLAALNNRLSENDLEKIFSSVKIAAEWSDVSLDLERFLFRGEKGGVNAGDRRAIYYLLRFLRSRSVLEIGTHIGASTIHIIAALKKTFHEDSKRTIALTSVDVRDVNDPKTRPWEDWGSSVSPMEMAAEMHASDWVKFVKRSSLDYLTDCKAKFDFIFLDGDHSAKTVYQEVPAALNCLNPGGVLLLHDYYPDGLPLWGKEPAIYGPWLAVSRFIQEGALLEALPLGELPWETKRNTCVTSLALLIAP